MSIQQKNGATQLLGKLLFGRNVLLKSEKAKYNFNVIIIDDK